MIRVTSRLTTPTCRPAALDWPASPEIDGDRWAPTPRRPRDSPATSPRLPGDRLAPTPRTHADPGPGPEPIDHAWATATHFEDEDPGRYESQELAEVGIHRAEVGID